MFLLLRVQCLNGMYQRRREQRQDGRVGGDNQRGFARRPLFLKSLQRQVAYVERQQRQLAKLLFNPILAGLIVSRQQDHLFFVQIGLLPNTNWLEGAIERNRMGEIIIDAKCETNVKGVFAAGDCTTVPYKQIIIATGEGAKASLSSFDYLIRTKTA